MPRRDEDLPGYWAVLFVRAMVQPPAGHDSPSPLLLCEEIYEEAVIAFTQFRALGIRNVIAFEAATPWLTRSRAYASPIALPRPSQGSLPAWTGSPLAGRDLHPLDDESKFHGVIAIPPIPIDQQSLVALFCLCAGRGPVFRWLRRVRLGAKPRILPRYLLPLIERQMQDADAFIELDRMRIATTCY